MTDVSEDFEKTKGTILHYLKPGPEASIAVDASGLAVGSVLLRKFRRMETHFLLQWDAE